MVHIVLGFQTRKKRQKLVAEWMREAGLEVREDGAGNIFGRLAGQQDNLPAIVSGSHLDTVPNGGHFDGVVGVLSALEVAEAWKQTGYQPEKPYEVAVFTDEEGSRFNGGLHGSEAVVGKGDLNEKLKQVDQDGKTFEQVLEGIGLTVDGYAAAERDADEIEMFVEAHIEQGKRLEQQGLPCGIVTGIAGPCWMEFTFTGEAGHAGNTPMTDRRDALSAAGSFVAEVPKLPGTVSDSAVATIGKLDVHPNGVNVIPGSVTLYTDIRDIYADTRDELVDKVLKLAEQIAASHDVQVEHVEKMRTPPVPIDEQNRTCLRNHSAGKISSHISSQAVRGMMR